jgi:hypothetical protein
MRIRLLNTLAMTALLGACVSCSSLGSHPELDQSGPCPDNAGRHLPLRVAAAGFHIDHPGDAADLDDLASKLPHELAMRLSRRDVLRAQDAGNVLIMPDPALTEPRQGETGARLLARHADVQFVVAGRVLSTAVTDRSVHLSLFSADRGSQQPPGMDYSGPFSALTGQHLKYRASARQFDLELWIYDGLDGRLLAAPRLTTLAQGDVWPKWRIPFASSEFWQGDYGRSVDVLLNQAAGRVNALLRCQPFASRVLRVESGGRIYFAAGSLDGVRAGDRFHLYRLQDELALPASPGGAPSQVPETLLGDVVVSQVQSGLSIAALQGAQVEVREGDVLRLVDKR